MDVEEVLAEQVDIEDEGDDVVEVTIEGKKKKGTIKTKKKTQVCKPKKHAEEWLKILLRSSNVFLANEHVFKDIYFL